MCMIHLLELCEDERRVRVEVVVKYERGEEDKCVERMRKSGGGGRVDDEGVSIDEI